MATASDTTASDTVTGDTAGRDRASLRRLTDWNPWIVLVAGILVAYHNSFAGKLAFDDHAYLGADKFTRLETLAAASNRPFLFWTLAANHRWGGSNAFGYHAVNLAIHLAAAITLALLVRCLTANRLRGGTWLAIATALVWGVHPLTTQAVTYLIQRGESLASLFYLLALFAVARSADRRAGVGVSAMRAALWGLFAILCAWLGMLSKEIAGTLPLAAVAVDRVCLATSWGDLLRRRSWLHIGMVSPWLWFSPWLMTYVTGYVARPSAEGELAGVGWTPWEYFSNQPAVILHYLRLAVWPDRLCLDYAWQPAERFLDVAPAFGLMVIAGLATIAGLWRRKLWGVALAGFFLVLAPSSSFMPIADLAFEHRMYLPLAFLVALAVYGGYGVIAATAVHWNAARLGPPLFIVLVAVAAVGFAFRTVARNHDYAEPARLWRSAIEINPRNYRAHSNLGCVMYEEGDYRGAAEAFATSLRLYREDGNAWAGLAACLHKLGELKTALSCFRKAIARLPRSAVAHNDMGACLDELGDQPGAEQSFRRALELDPNFAIAAHNLGDLLLRREEDEEATQWLELALRLDPQLAAARRKLAWLLATTADAKRRDPDRAARELEPLLARLATQSRRSPVDALASTATGKPQSEAGIAATGFAAARLFDTSAAIHAARLDFALALRTLDRALSSLSAADGTSMDATPRFGDAAVEFQKQLLQRRALYAAGQPFIRKASKQRMEDASTAPRLVAPPQP